MMNKLQIATIIVPLLFSMILFTWESFTPFFIGRTLRFSHIIKNLLFVSVNFAPIILLTSLTILILDWIHPNFNGIKSIPISPVMQSVLILLLMDLWLYFWHRLNHRVSFFWKFHQVHHLDSEMDFSTAFRTHFGELLMSEFFRLPFLVCIGAQAEELIIYNLILSPVILLHHSNVKLPEKIDSILKLVIASPNFHRVHHSNIQSETDSNYGGVLSLWDRFFKSYNSRKNIREIIFGINEKSTGTESFVNLMKRPFIHFQI